MSLIVFIIHYYREFVKGFNLKMMVLRLIAYVPLYVGKSAVFRLFSPYMGVATVHCLSGISKKDRLTNGGGV